MSTTFVIQSLCNFRGRYVPVQPTLESVPTAPIVVGGAYLCRNTNHISRSAITSIGNHATHSPNHMGGTYS